MPTSLNEAVADLPAAVGSALEEFVEAARATFGTSLRSVVLYGSAAEGRLRPTSDVNVILVLDAFDRAAADRLRGPLGTARAAIGLAVMFLLADEVRPASEAFAAKFADILRRRRVLFGEDPFRGLSIPRPAEVVRLKQVLLNLTLRLRASYAASGDREELLARIVADSAGPLRAGAATLRELQGRPSPTGKKALEDLTAELSDAKLEEALARLSEARRTGTLPPGRAGDTLLALIELAQRMRAQVEALS
jgi:predicted nucleotidyltransferase